MHPDTLGYPYTLFLRDNNGVEMVGTNTWLGRVFGVASFGYT